MIESPASLVIFLRISARHRPQNQIDQTEYDSPEKCRKESFNPESRDEPRGEFQHQRVDHKPKHTKRHESKRERDDLEEQPDGCIDETDDKSRNQSRPETGDFETTDDVSHDHQTQRAEK